MDFILLKKGSVRVQLRNGLRYHALCGSINRPCAMLPISEANDRQS